MKYMKVCHVVFSTNRVEFLKKTFEAQKKFDYSGVEVHKLFIDDYPLGRDNESLSEFVKSYGYNEIILHEENLGITKTWQQLFDIVKDRDYDILYLGYNEIPGFHKENLSEFLAKPSGLITGMYAYIVSPQGAKKILNTIFPLNKQIDSSISDNGDSFNKLCSAKKIANVRIDFGSKTQQANSCINANNFDTQKIKKIDEWNKLFV